MLFLCRRCVYHFDVLCQYAIPLTTRLRAPNHALCFGSFGPGLNGIFPLPAECVIAFWDQNFENTNKFLDMQILDVVLWDTRVVTGLGPHSSHSLDPWFEARTGDDQAMVQALPSGVAPGGGWSRKHDWGPGPGGSARL